MDIIYYNAINCKCNKEQSTCVIKTGVLLKNEKETIGKTDSL